MNGKLHDAVELSDELFVIEVTVLVEMIGTDQKDIIEGRLKELSIEEMIMQNRVTQDIPIIPGKFWFELQSMTTEEDLAVKRLIHDLGWHP